MVRWDAQKNDQTSSTFFFLSFKLVLAIAWPYFSPKTHETGPKVLVLAQAMPRAKKAQLNHMLLMGGQIYLYDTRTK